MKAAEEAKATVTGLESQLSALKAAQAGTIPQAKGAFDGPIAATQNALDAAKKNAADKEAAAKSYTTTSGTTTGGGTEDKVKAAEEAKATVTGLESQLSALKAAQAGTIPQAKGAFDGPIAATQNALDAAKKNAADKEAAAKSPTTTSGTTTGGGTEDKVKAAEEAKATVTGLESQLSALKAAQAGTIPQAKGAFDGPIAATQNALDAAKKNAADKEVAAKSPTTTSGTTTGGGTEDKVKAAEEAKAVVTNLETQLNALKDKEAKAAPEAKGQLQSQIAQLQTVLDTAKKDAADKDALAKSAITTPGTTTTGGGGGTTTTSTTGGGSKLQFPTAEEKAKYDAAEKDVTDLKTQLEKAKENLAKNVEPPLPIAQQNALKKNVANLEAKLTTAQKKVTDLAKGAKIIPPTPKGTPQQPKKDFNDNNDRKNQIRR